MNKNLEAVRSIFQEDKRNIINEFGGIGAGITKRNEEYIIVVYTDKGIKVSKDQKWKGIQVEIKYTGPIRALDKQ
jgi:hypothetical protein